MPYVKAITLTEAYVRSLELLRSNHHKVDHLTVEIFKSLNLGSLATPLEKNYERIITFRNYRKLHEKYKLIRFGKRNGSDWIENRIKELCPTIKRELEELKGIIKRLRDFRDEIRNSGRRFLVKESYRDRILKYGDYRNSLFQRFPKQVNQLAVIIFKLIEDVLKRQSSFVYAVISVFDPLKENLGLIGHKGFANIGPFPCLTALDFKLTNYRINLCAFWRHQYFDIKAYGNWISLAILLKIVCETVNYFQVKEVQPGKITTVACRADFKNPRFRKKVYRLIT